MPIAILGGRGQLAGELRHRLGEKAIAFGREQIDIANPEQMDAVLSAHSIEAVINCAAYNAVNLAESEPETAFRINALGPRFLAAFCERNQIPLVHVSTDYVFGLDAGRRIAYRETDLPGPLGAYAVTKLAGEEFVRAGCVRHFLLRTCGLYGQHGQTGKRNFVETMLSLSGGREAPGSQPIPETGAPRPVKVVADQRCTPTSCADLAQVIVALINTTAYGTYHATNAGDCSWAEFAAEIFRIANRPAEVVPITTADYGAQARRPAFSVLNGDRLAGILGHPQRHWREALAEYLAQRTSPTR